MATSLDESKVEKGPGATCARTCFGNEVKEMAGRVEKGVNKVKEEISETLEDGKSPQSGSSSMGDTLSRMALRKWSIKSNASRSALWQLRSWREPPSVFWCLASARKPAPEAQARFCGIWRSEIARACGRMRRKRTCSLTPTLPRSLCAAT